MADEAKTKDFEVTNGNIVTGVDGVNKVGGETVTLPEGAGDALKKAGLVK